MISEEIMSVAEARELMPDTTSSLSDEEVSSLLNNLELLATAFIQAVQFNDEFRVNIEYNRGQKAE
jgi:hypothetical protein